MLLTYGLKEGVLKSIQDVELGKDCNCFCPNENCNSKLIAKNRKGNKRALHFAHESGADCSGAIESAKHLLAKEIIKNSKKVWLPDLHFFDIIEVPNEKVIKGRLIEFVHVILEKRTEIESNDYFVPDVKCLGENDLMLNVEIANTHFVDEKKGQKIIKAGVSTIEIDISDLPLDEEAIKNRIEMPSDRKKWLFNQALSKSVYLGSTDYKKLLYDEMLTNQLQIDMKGGASFVKISGDITYSCPIENIERESKILEFKKSEGYGHGVLRDIVENGGWDGIIHVDSPNGKYIVLNGEKKFLYLSRAVFLDVTAHEEFLIYEEGLKFIAEHISVEKFGLCDLCSHKIKRYSFFDNHTHSDIVQCGFTSVN